MTVTSLFGQPY